MWSPLARCSLCAQQYVPRAGSGIVVLEPPLHDDTDPRPDPLTVELAELIAGGDRNGALHRFHAAIGVPEELVAEMADSPSWASMVDVADTAVYDCMISDAVDRALLGGVTAPYALDDESCGCVTRTRACFVCLITATCTRGELRWIGGFSR